jgi:hypothetical protein
MVEFIAQRTIFKSQQAEADRNDASERGRYESTYVGGTK